MAAPVLLTDNFDSDTSANYSILDNSATDDFSVSFAYDYGADGIASAPNSVGGTTSGVKITVNDSDNTRMTASIVPITPITASYFEMSVDIYMGVEGTSGTTEFGIVGVSGDGTTVISPFEFVDTGHYLFFTGEGGASSDFRHVTPSGITNSGDPSYLTPSHTTNATGTLYQDIFQSPEYEFAGSPGNNWATLSVLVDDGQITYSFNGTPIIQAAYDGSDGDYITLGLYDYYSSSAVPSQSQYVIFDNLIVTQVPEPSAFLLLGLGLAGAVRMRKGR